MRPDDDEFEFEFDDDDEEEEEEEEVKTPKKTKKGAGKKKTQNEKGSKKSGSNDVKTAKRMPISDGIKRRLLKNMKEIAKLKDELESCQDEKESYEKEFEMLEDELETLRGEKEKFEDDLNQKVAVVNAMEKKLDRNQKDFDNFRKRNQNDVDRQVKMGSKNIIMGIIDVIDNFDRALMEAKKSDWKSGVKPIIEGLESTRKGLMKVLNDNGVELVDPISEPFDPNFHEAFEIVEDKSVPDNTVIDVDVKGYVLEGIVLRPAKVRVSKGGKPRKKKKVEEDTERFSKDEEKDDEDRDDLKVPKKSREEEDEGLPDEADELEEEEEMEELDELDDEE